MVGRNIIGYDFRDCLTVSAKMEEVRSYTPATSILVTDPGENSPHTQDTTEQASPV